MRTLLVHLEGADPAIREHRLSLDQLAAFAKLITNAYRRSAQEMLTGHKDGRGKLPDRAKDLQLELVTFEEGCVQMRVAPRDLGGEGTPLQLGEPLEDGALWVLAQGISGAKGSARVNPAVQKAVRFFDKGIRQRYELSRDGQVELCVEFSSDELPAAIIEHPRTRIEHRIGRATGVIVEPSPVVFFTADEDVQRRLSATRELVEKAWSLRDEKNLVASVVVSSKMDRLVALRPLAEFNTWRNAKRSATPEAVAKRWESALEALAEYDRN